MAAAAALLALAHRQRLVVEGRHGLHGRPGEGVLALRELRHLGLVAAPTRGRRRQSATSWRRPPSCGRSRGSRCSRRPRPSGARPSSRPPRWGRKLCGRPRRRRRPWEAAAGREACEETAAIRKPIIGEGPCKGDCGYIDIQNTYRVQRELRRRARMASWNFSATTHGAARHRSPAAHSDGRPSTRTSPRAQDRRSPSKGALRRRSGRCSLAVVARRGAPMARAEERTGGNRDAIPGEAATGPAPRRPTGPCRGSGAAQAHTPRP